MEAETMTETWFESYKRGFRNGGEMTEKYTREKETLSWVRNTQKHCYTRWHWQVDLVQ